MRTKRLMLAVLFCGPLYLCSAQAQGLYLGIGGGYGFAAAKQSFMDDYKTTVGASGSSNEATSHPISFGKGINAGIYAGYMFNPNIGAELGVSYLLGSKNVFTDEYSNTASSSSDKTESTWKARMIRLVPAIRMTAGEGSIHPYMKSGLIIGLGGKITEESITNSSFPSGSSVAEESWEYTGGLSLGFHGALGLNFMLSDMLGIYAEVAGNYQNWAMKKGSMTKSTVDGIDQMGMMETNDKEVEFVDSYTYDPSMANPGQPSQSTKFYTPFSSIGLNVGVHIVLGGK